MFIDLTKLTRDNIVGMLEAQGYNDSSSDIVDTKYVSCNNGHVKYRITFYDIDNFLKEGYVYVYIDSEGKLVTDY